MKDETDQSSNGDFNQIHNQLKANYFIQNKLSGQISKFDQQTGMPIHGYYLDGYKVGKWIIFRQDKQIIADYQIIRIGAISKNGKQSKATGSGACSRNGGVKQWLHEGVVYNIEEILQTCNKSFSKQISELKELTKTLLDLHQQQHGSINHPYKNLYKQLDLAQQLIKQNDQKQKSFQNKTKEFDQKSSLQEDLSLKANQKHFSDKKSQKIIDLPPLFNQK